ncbi:MAG TPA: ABC transporter ATP-binding protein [Dehalococcoidia bacterium]
MNDVAVRVENLGKLYRIGQIVGYKTLRESLTNAMALPFRRLKQAGDRRQKTVVSGHPSSVLGHPDTIWALKNVSFEVKHSEAIAIIGSNGAGKSTLLKILSRITTPTEGYAEIHGRVGSLLEVGAGFHAELTGRENIYLNGAVLGMKRAEVKQKFDEIVEFSGVEKFLDTPVKRYSSGMYVRLAFAIAAHIEPEILIVDEVLAVGDASFQKKCLGKMDDVVKSGRTILFVSHNMTAVKTLCPRAILLNQGVIELEGSTHEVVQHYLGTAKVTSGQVSWPAHQRPGNCSFKLNSVTLKSLDGSQTSSVKMSQGAFVEIDFEVIEDGAQAGFSLVLFDSEVNDLFGSLSNTERNYYGKPLRCGRYISTCRLPGDLLNAGTFSISIIGFGAHFSDQFRVDSALSFSAIDDGILRGDYYGGYGGPLRPRLEWRTRRYES